MESNSAFSNGNWKKIPILTMVPVLPIAYYLEPTERGNVNVDSLRLPFPTPSRGLSMKLFSRNWKATILTLNLLALSGSSLALGQERLGFEIESEPGTVAQVSMETMIDESHHPAAADHQATPPRIVFLPGDTGTLDRESEAYEIRFEPIDENGQKRLKISIPTSVAEIEISHLTISRLEAEASNVKLSSAVLNHRSSNDSASKSSVPQRLAPPSGIPFKSRHRLLPLPESGASHIRNPYFLEHETDKVAVKTENKTAPKDYTSTPYGKIQESLSDDPSPSESSSTKSISTLTDSNSDRIAEKPISRVPVRARLSDLK